MAAPGEVSATVSAGTELLLTATASGVIPQGASFVLNYDSQILDVEDFAVQRYETVTGPGTYGNLTISSVKPGEVVFMINTIPETGFSWSGMLTKMKFIALADGEATVTIKAI